MYKDEFQSALKRNGRLGLVTPNVTFTNERFANDDNLSLFEKRYQAYIYDVNQTAEETAYRCLSVNMDILDLMSKIFKTEMFYTIGYVSTEEQTFYKQTEESLKGLLDSPQSKKSIELHAWLTLPSMEILDLTFSTSYAMRNKDDRGIGGVIFSHADELNKSLRFHPMVIGAEYLFKCGAVRAEITEI